MTGPRFVEVPATRLVGELESIGAKVTAAGGTFAWKRAGAERVFDLTVPGGRAVVRIYTTLDGGENARDCGEDAVRVVLGTYRGEKFIPLDKGQKILRTAPQSVADRVAAFLERLRGEVRETYARGKEVPACPQCGKAMQHRTGRFGPFLGCVMFPECRAIVNVRRAS